jgi:hypothetical protein
MSQVATDEIVRRAVETSTLETAQNGGRHRRSRIRHAMSMLRSAWTAPDLSLPVPELREYPLPRR